MVQRGMPGSTPALPSGLIPELQAPCGLCDYPIQTEASRGEAWLLSLANHPPKPLRLILRPGSLPHIPHSSFVLLCKPRQTQPHFPHHPSFFGDQERETGRALEMYFWNCWGYIYLALCWLGSLPGTAKECLKKMHWRLVSRQMRVHYHPTPSRFIQVPLNSPKVKMERTRYFRLSALLQSCEAGNIIIIFMDET